MVRAFAAMLVAAVALAVSSIAVRADTPMPVMVGQPEVFKVDLAEQYPEMFTRAASLTDVASDRLKWDAGLGNEGLMRFGYNGGPTGSTLQLPIRDDLFGQPY